MPERRSADQTAPPASLPLTTRELVFRSGTTNLIDRINLTMDDNRITIVMGPNGAGKSLLLRLLHGLIAPSSGAIDWNGVAIEQARTVQAMVFQRPVLLRRSVAANLDFALDRLPDRTGDRVARRTQLLSAAGLADKEKQPARLLSGGEQQRLALARALAMNPQVLFLDEPTASLDPMSVQLIEQQVCTAQRAGTKIVFVTHDLGQARRLAGDIIFLHRGRIAERGNADTFFDQPASDAAKAYLAGQLVL